MPDDASQGCTGSGRTWRQCRPDLPRGTRTRCVRETAPIGNGRVEEIPCSMEGTAALEPLRTFRRWWTWPAWTQPDARP